MESFPARLSSWTRAYPPVSAEQLAPPAAPPHPPPQSKLLRNCKQPDNPGIFSGASGMEMKLYRELTFDRERSIDRRETRAWRAEPEADKTHKTSHILLPGSRGNEGNLRHCATEEPPKCLLFKSTKSPRIITPVHQSHTPPVSASSFQQSTNEVPFGCCRTNTNPPAAANGRNPASPGKSSAQN